MSSTRKLTGKFVLLSAGNTKILLPQEQIGQVTYVSADTVWSKDKDSVGMFVSEKFKEKKFVALASDLKPLVNAFDDRLITLPFVSSDNHILWCWHNAQAVNDVDLDIFSLPDFVLPELSPIKEYVLYNGHIVYLCDTKSLEKYAFSEV